MRGMGFWIAVSLLVLGCTAKGWSAEGTAAGASVARSPEAAHVDPQLEQALVAEDWEQVLARAEAWRQREPDSVLAGYIVGKAYSCLGEPQRMLWPWDPLDVAWVWHREQIRPLAEWARNLASRHPASPIAWSMLSNLLMFSGDEEGCLKAAERAAALAPHDGYHLMVRGGAHYNAGNYDEAVRDCTSALGLRPDLAEAYLVRGWAYGDKKEREKALADFTAAIELVPDYLNAYYWRGDLYLRRREPDQALAEFDKIIALEPSCAWPYWARAIAHYLRRDYARAVADVTTYVETFPMDAEAWFQKARACRQAGRTEDAMDALHRFVALAPEAGLSWRIPEAQVLLRELGDQVR